MKRFCFWILPVLAGLMLAGCIVKTPLSTPSDTEPSSSAESSAVQNKSEGLNTPADLYALLGLDQKEIDDVEQYLEAWRPTMNFEILGETGRENAEQTALLDRLRVLGYLKIGNLVYLERRVLGEAEPPASRLDKETVQNTVDRCLAEADGDVLAASAAVYKEIKAVQPYPDLVAGSGMTRREYWFNDEGTSGFMIISEAPEEGGSLYFFERPGYMSPGAEKTLTDLLVNS